MSYKHLLQTPKTEKHHAIFIRKFSVYSYYLVIFQTGSMFFNTTKYYSFVHIAPAEVVES